VLGSKIRQGEWHVLIQWAGMSTSEATWEPVDQFRTSFPTFQLEDELFVGGGGGMLCTQEGATPKPESHGQNAKRSWESVAARRFQQVRCVLACFCVCSRLEIKAISQGLVYRRGSTGD
jgi:hypothetical protein